MTTATKKPTIKMVEDAICADQVTLRNGVFTVRESFFYSGGRSEENLLAEVQKAFPNAVIVGKGEVWMPFKGGASIANQSHWFVKFTL